MNEPQQAAKIAEKWVDFQMDPLVQMVHGDPDCDAVLLARQYRRACEVLAYLDRLGGLGFDKHNMIKTVFGQKPI